MFEGSDSLFNTMFAQTFFTNPSKLRIDLCKIPHRNFDVFSGFIFCQMQFSLRDVKQDVLCISVFDQDMYSPNGK